MTPATLLPLALFAVVATITPGGATTLATASGARFGFRRSVPLIAGISVGLGALGAASALGLASLVLAVPTLALALRLGGSAYLLWLSVKIATSGPPDTDTRMAAPIGVLGGAMLLWLNPKAWATALGAAATFGDAASSPSELALLLASVFVCAAAISLTLWSTAGFFLAKLLHTRREWTIVNTLLGILLALSILQMWL
ncbi:LysE family translocator [Kaustia mangrovi]|uniref:LysE family translocator n=1 Tax=Kaustia mangrovi TaxID=2593653 RepID=A0A7S8HBU7_9HYPH|nr:LysE family translocator [Kaustia mangrovi]QPC42779.1 LysE family translocator [Kaustia mangrovi]